MDSVLVFFKNLIRAWPSILMGALIPAVALGVLFFSKKRKTTAFKAVLYGAASFFASLAMVAVLLLTLAQFFMPMITVSQASSANSYIFIFGIFKRHFIEFYIWFIWAFCIFLTTVVYFLFKKNTFSILYHSIIQYSRQIFLFEFIFYKKITFL